MVRCTKPRGFLRAAGSASNTTPIRSWSRTRRFRLVITASLAARIVTMILNLSASSQVGIQEMALPEMPTTISLLDRRGSLACSIKAIEKLTSLLSSILQRKAITCLSISQGFALATCGQTKGIRTQTRLPLRQEDGRAMTLLHQTYDLPSGRTYRAPESIPATIDGKGASTVRTSDAFTAMTVTQGERKAEVSLSSICECMAETGTRCTL